MRIKVKCRPTVGTSIRMLTCGNGVALPRIAVERKTQGINLQQAEARMLTLQGRCEEWEGIIRNMATW